MDLVKKMIFKLEILSKQQNGTTFDVFIRNTFYETFTIPSFGDHNVLNALAVIAFCQYEEIDTEDVRRQLLILKV